MNIHDDNSSFSSVSLSRWSVSTIGRRLVWSGWALMCSPLTACQEVIPTTGGDEAMSATAGMGPTTTGPGGGTLSGTGFGSLTASGGTGFGTTGWPESTGTRGSTGWPSTMTTGATTTWTGGSTTGSEVGETGALDTTGDPTVSDVGVDCNPDAHSCNELCLGLGDSSGVCVTDCSDDGLCDAAAGERCNFIPLDDGSNGQFCLPNASCGTLDFFGRCEGDLAIFCDIWGPETIDCSEHTDEAGRPKTCGSVPNLGAACVPRDDGGGGCMGETEVGRCDGSVVIYCFEGSVERYDCASEGLACGFDSELGGYDCIDSGP